MLKDLNRVTFLDWKTQHYTDVCSHTDLWFHCICQSKFQKVV